MASKKTKEPEPGSGPGAALRELQELYRFMQENDIEAAEVERKDCRVKLVRRSSRPVQVPVPVFTAGAQAPSAPVPEAGSPAPSAAPAALPANAVIVKAPMMGIFYRAASPSSPPFAKEGDEVKAGDVLCLIEAMKVFNDVKAEYGGVVLRVLIDNGKPVKVGQDLLILERK